jgi:hypothetical protein
MWGTNFCRAKYSRFNAVTHSPKVFTYALESDVEVVGHVFEEAKSWQHLSDNPGNMWPEVSWIFCSLALSSN